MSEEQTRIGLEIHPLTAERWADLESLFGPRGACAGCWCMYWRLGHAEFSSMSGEGNRFALRQIVETGEVPGLLAYAGGKAVGWVAVEPRAEFPRLGRSRILKPVDEQPVWSIVCFFVAKTSRKQGLSVHLLTEAVRFAAEQGAKIVEGYPVDPRDGDYPDAFAYIGTVSAFRQAGFKEVLRRSEKRPIMRYLIESQS
ncbi:MAG: GNAT family N-acetyltransferase [Anaerolineaceae bacterium]|nr:GNAT family N-acetyltransferase [Anaerolineaceae bacterium]